MFAQTPDIESYVSRIERGEEEQVRLELPALVTKYPKEPGIMYLQGMLTLDGAEAVRNYYQKIVDAHPNSEWADDALYKVYKFYYALGLYRTAESKLNQLKANYPNSKYASETEGLKEVTEGRTEPSLSPTVSIDKSEENKAEESSKPATTIPVETTKEEASASEREKAPGVVPSLGKFTLQVGAYSTRANATKQQMLFAYHKYPAEIVGRMRGSKELFFVYVGTYKTEAEAKTIGEEIRKSLNIDYVVVAR
jgi:cell division septation protein DedD